MAVELVMVTSFGFYNHGALFSEQHLLRRGKICLSRQGKNMFTVRMAELIRRALNKEWWGRDRATTGPVREQGTG